MVPTGLPARLDPAGVPGTLTRRPLPRVGPHLLPDKTPPLMPPQLPETADALLPEPIGAGLAPQRPVVAAPKTMLWPVLRGLGIAVLAVAWALIAHVTSAGNESSGWGAALAVLLGARARG